MGLFRIPTDVAAKLVSDFRRRRLIGLVVSVLLGSVAAVVFLWPRNQVDLDRCRELYASARTSADSAAVDTLALTLRDKRDPERGGKEPVRCAVVRESRVSGLTAVGADGRARVAGRRPRFIVPEGPAWPSTRI